MCLFLGVCVSCMKTFLAKIKRSHRDKCLPIRKGRTVRIHLPINFKECSSLQKVFFKNTLHNTQAHFLCVVFCHYIFLNAMYGQNLFKKKTRLL